MIIEDSFAFPIPELHINYGMTLRDYFAAKALQGLLSNSTLEVNDKTMPGEKALAISVYAIADAMLEIRQEMKEQELQEFTEKGTK